MRYITLAGVALLGLSAVFVAALPVAAQDALPKAFACEFDGGVTTTFENGAFVSRKPAPLQFIIVDIDLDGQSAHTSTGPAGTIGTLRIVRALNANHFLEVVNEGFLNLTTIYDYDAKAGAYPAIHSRHFGVLGQPVTAQYTGFCKAH